MKLTEVIRRYNHAWDAHYAEALLNLFKKGGAPLMCLGAVSVIAIILGGGRGSFPGTGQQRALVPIAAGLRALQLSALARVLTGASSADPWMG